MSDQLEAETQETPVEAEATEVQQESVDSQNTPDSALDSEQQHEKPVEIPLDAQKIIADKAFQEREAKREAKALREQLEALQAKEESAPVVGNIPDRWDFDDDSSYQEAVKDYANKSAEVRLHEERQRALQQQQAYQEQQKLAEQQKALAEKAGVYTSRAEKLGVKGQDLQAAGQVIEAYGLSPEIATAILDDLEGPLMTVYLASNPTAIQELNAATFMTAGQVFADVKAKASQLKPKASSTPPPADVLTGGAPRTQRGPSGATFK